MTRAPATPLPPALRTMPVRLPLGRGGGAAPAVPDHSDAASHTAVASSTISTAAGVELIRGIDSLHRGMASVLVYALQGVGVARRARLCSKRNVTLRSFCSAGIFAGRCEFSPCAARGGSPPRRRCYRFTSSATSWIIASNAACACWRLPSRSAISRRRVSRRVSWSANCCV